MCPKCCPCEISGPSAEILYHAIFIQVRAAVRASVVPGAHAIYVGRLKEAASERGGSAGGRPSWPGSRAASGLARCMPRHGFLFPPALLGPCYPSDL